MNIPWRTFSFLIFVFGTSYVFRTWQILLAEKLIEKSVLTKIGTVFTAITLLILGVSTESFWPLFFEQALICACMFSLKKYLVTINERRYSSEFEVMLGSLALCMKRGESFRSAMATLASEAQTPSRHRLNELWRIVYFSQHISKNELSPLDLRILQVFTSLDRQSYGVIQRCDFFRRQLLIERKFCQRSRDLLWQPRYQAIILSVIYLVLLLSTPIVIGWSKDIWLFFIPSMGLFGLGLLLLLRLSRRFKWNW